MRHLILVLLGLILVGGVGYFVGYDHGFEKAGAHTQPVAWHAFGAAASAMSRIVGAWQSNEDPKFIREIRNDGSVVDRYEGTDDSEGRWMIFTKDVPNAEFPYPFEDGVIYLSLAMSETEKYYFKIVHIDERLMQLVYLDRGGSLSFTRLP
jgi:hypothetical protein